MQTRNKARRWLRLRVQTPRGRREDVYLFLSTAAACLSSSLVINFCLTISLVNNEGTRPIKKTRRGHLSSKTCHSSFKQTDRFTLMWRSLPAAYLGLQRSQIPKILRDISDHLPSVILSQFISSYFFLSFLLFLCSFFSFLLCLRPPQDPHSLPTTPRYTILHTMNVANKYCRGRGSALGPGA